MSRRDREIEALKAELLHQERLVKILRARNNLDRENLNRIKAEVSCPACAVLRFDLDLARETIDDLAAQFSAANETIRELSKRKP
jgi:hypothetical protein